jgi:hypothetical protein
VNELLGQLSILERQLEVRQKPVRVHDAHRGLLKRILIDQRRENAESIDAPLQKAVDGQIIAALRRDIQFIEHLMLAPWFDEVEAFKIPEVTDYLSIRHAEAALPEPLVLRPREYDEKFHILEAPSLFLPDLGFYRKKCRFRGAPIAVAYSISTISSRSTRAIRRPEWISTCSRLLWRRSRRTYFRTATRTASVGTSIC